MDSKKKELFIIRSQDPYDPNWNNQDNDGVVNIETHLDVKTVTLALKRLGEVFSNIEVTLRQEIPIVVMINGKFENLCLEPIEKPMT